MVILRPIGTIGNRLKYLRKTRGLTRKKAAVKLNIKEERLQDLETGRKGLTLEEAIRIIEGLDTSNSEENIEAKKMAVKALEEQRQKKIETWNGQASCPRCKFCGQALDWSDEQ